MSYLKKIQLKIQILLIIGMTVFPLVFQQGFSQCIYNYDWPDAPCFDMGPVTHLEFYKAWAPYYDYKGSEWMETKKVEMNQALEGKIIEEWVNEIENYNVYRYYLSRNEITSSLPYDSFFVNLDPNFKMRELISDENVCGPNTVLIDGICTTACGKGTVLVNGRCEIIITEPSHYVNTSPFYQSLLLFSVFLWPYFISGSAIFIVLAKTPRYKQSTIIAVTASASLVIVLFLIMMFIGIWPQFGD